MHTVNRRGGKILSYEKRALFTSGFEKPSAIQQRAIVPVIKGRDVIAQ